MIITVNNDAGKNTGAITCPTFTTFDNQNSYNISYMSSETAGYNCSTNILLSQDPQDKNKSNPIVITITAMDPSENKDYLNIIVFVKDMEAPTFTGCDTTKTTVVSTESDYGMNTTHLVPLSLQGEERNYAQTS